MGRKNKEAKQEAATVSDEKIEALEFWLGFDPEEVDSDVIDAAHQLSIRVLEDTEEGFDRDEALRAIRHAVVTSMRAIRNSATRREQSAADETANSEVGENAPPAGESAATNSDGTDPALTGQ